MGWGLWHGPAAQPPFVPVPAHPTQPLVWVSACPDIHLVGEGVTVVTRTPPPSPPVAEAPRGVPAPGVPPMVVSAASWGWRNPISGAPTDFSHAGCRWHEAAPTPCPAPGWRGGWGQVAGGGDKAIVPVLSPRGPARLRALPKPAWCRRAKNCIVTAPRAQGAGMGSGGILLPAGSGG